MISRVCFPENRLRLIVNNQIFTQQMGKGKANKKSHQNKHKDTKNEPHKTATDKKKGNHGNNSTTRSNMVHHEVENLFIF